VIKPEVRPGLASDGLRRVRQLQRAHEGKQVVLVVERAGLHEGHVSASTRIELYLERCGVRRPGEVRLHRRSEPGEGVEEYQVLREEIERRVGRMNGRFATLSDSPVRFIYGSVTFTELCALYALADVAIVTPLMDGMT
jgi:trehalose-6-phosphate synthase